MVGAYVYARTKSPLLDSLVYCMLCPIPCLSSILCRSILTVAPYRAQTNIHPLCAAPAQEAIRYQREVFPNAFSELTHFMGEPSPQLDSYWEEIYNVPSRIPKWQAERLEHPSIELPGDEDYYVILLNIFHSTHCLNEIRKSLHPEYYAPYHIRVNTTEEKAQMHLGEPFFSVFLIHLLLSFSL